ncbi:MAG: hypothetical protein VB140_00185 [Burkholderia sp.]
MASMGIVSGDTNGLRTSEVRNPFVSPETMPIDAIASDRSIYATKPPLNRFFDGWVVHCFHAFREWECPI